MTKDQRMEALRVFLSLRISLEEVFKDTNVRLHMNNLGYYLTPPQDSGYWELRTPDFEIIQIRNAEHLYQYFK